MVKLSERGGEKRRRGNTSGDYRECGANYQRFLLNLPCAGGGGHDHGCWLLFLLLLMLSNVSHECPTQCQCLWKFGKESVSCFRGSLTKIPAGLDPGTQVRIYMHFKIFSSFYVMI